MKYIEIKIEVSPKRFDLLVGNLEDEGFDQLIIDDPQDAREIIEHKDWYKYDYINTEITDNLDRWPTITIYATDDEDGMYDIQKINDCIWTTITYLEDMGNHEASYDFKVTQSLTDDQDWLYKWQEYFKPTKVSERIVVKPTWESYDAAEDDLVIEIDPGMAFGTGTHETTSMCLKALEKHVKSDDKVLDVGCGSGILAIGAALLGAKEALGIEIDTDAVEVAKSNVELNHLSDKISVQYGDLTKGIDYKADIVVANLMADLVIMLTPDVAKHLNPGGIYISSGILNEKEELVSNAITAAGFTIEEVLHDGEWCCIIARRKHNG